MIDPVFNPDRAVAIGKDKIVSLILPNAAESIPDGVSYINHVGGEAAFRYFSNLKSVSAPNLAFIGDYAFNGVSIVDHGTHTEDALDGPFNLVNVSFPQVRQIGTAAFMLTQLPSVDFPVLATMSDAVFFGCDNLTSVRFPNSAVIINNPFDSAPRLNSFVLINDGGNLSTMASGRALVRDGVYLIAYPTATGDVTLSTVTHIGVRAFWGDRLNTPLNSLTLPDVIDIGLQAFATSRNLGFIHIPNVEYIDWGAFSGFRENDDTLIIYMGGTAPRLSQDVFSMPHPDFSRVINVTVRVPAAATGYGSSPTDLVTQNWGNAFRGMGWNGTIFLGGTVSPDINLSIEYLP
jgi:hypothetical protein